MADFAGGLALQRVQRSKRWRVMSVYRCCFYCEECEGDIICIGTETIGRGPITIGGKSFDVLLNSGISQGDILHSKDGRINFSNSLNVLDVSKAEIWEATFNCYQRALPSLERDTKQMIEFSHHHSPPESLGQLIPGILSRTFRNSDKSHLSTQFSQLLHGRVLGVMKNMYHGATCNHQRNTANELACGLASLIGTGYGLTPSGDDFCCGVVLGIAQMGNYRTARELAILLNNDAVGRTSRISQAYYQSLAKSFISEPQALLLSSFGNSGGVDLGKILMNNANHGSTSGWDMLAGFAFGLELTQKHPGTIDAVSRERCVC